MRVLHLCAGNLYGGVERMLVTLAKAARDGAGHVRHEFAYCFEGRFADEIRAQGAPCHALGSVRISRPWTRIGPRRVLGGLIRDRAIEVLVSHGAWPHALFASVAHKRGAATVFWLHDPPQLGGLSWLEALAARHRPRLVIGNSEYTLARGRQLFSGVERKLIRCPVEDGTPVDRDAVRSRWREKLGTPADDVVIFQVGRWERHKGHLCLLDALGRLRDVNGWTCWIAGEPQRDDEIEYCNEARARATALGIQDRTRFLGWVDRVEQLYCAVDVYCQPNVRPEPFGITFVESLYSGVPIVATADGGPVEIVGGDARLGTLVPANDPAALADALRAIVASPVRRAAAAEAGPRRARELCDPGDRLRELNQTITNFVPTERRPSLDSASA